ncbi:hypothetical protein, partial [Psychrobacillus soli]|uniref:hypothetical protein n=1 Tax=Psychrobacillus soli TaxID=1543965 RepID=UPI001C8D0D20
TSCGGYSHGGRQLSHEKQAARILSKSVHFKRAKTVCFHLTVTICFAYWKDVLIFYNLGLQSILF